MQAVTLQMSDSVAEHIMYFLRQLPKKEVKIVEEKHLTENKLAQQFAEWLQNFLYIIWV